jgi:hypothetical protein
MRSAKEERKMQAQIVKGQLVITLALQTPTPSASGKTLIVASSRGVKSSDLKVKGKVLCITANAFVYPDNPADKKSVIKRKTGGGGR